MRRLLLALFLLWPPLCAHAWNAAGHRLAAVIAWQQLSPPSREAIGPLLARHPDHSRWVDRARSADDIDVFAEAATWSDDIRHDPRFHDEEREAPTPPLRGLTDTARHKRWHYVDLDPQGRAVAGEIDRQIECLARLLAAKIGQNSRSTADWDEMAYALPWLLHLVADLHQPLHVGRQGDEGGNAVEIENPYNKRLPFSSLHLYWDDLPGPPWLRGQRLEKSATRLLENQAAPPQGDVTRWRDESHRLLDSAYPDTNGSLLPIVTEEFHRRAREIADRRVTEAGYRLGRLLEAIFGGRVSRGTP